MNEEELRAHVNEKLAELLGPIIDKVLEVAPEIVIELRKLQVFAPPGFSQRIN